MSSMPHRGSGLSTPIRPQTGNAGPIPSLDRPPTSSQGDTGVLGGVQDKIHDLTTGASEMAGQVRDTTRRWVDSTTNRVEQGWESTRHSVEGAWDEAVTFVRRHPAASLMAAFGLGALVASCFIATNAGRGFERSMR
jgi:hypothetical protein